MTIPVGAVVDPPLVPRTARPCHGMMAIDDIMACMHGVMTSSGQLGVSSSTDVAGFKWCHPAIIMTAIAVTRQCQVNLSQAMQFVSSELFCARHPIVVSFCIL